MISDIQTTCGWLGRASRIALAATVSLASALVGLGGPVLATTTTTDGGSAKLMLVLDASGSMAWDAGDGQPRIKAARQALHAVVDQLPDDQEVGMRVYGAGPFREGDAGACTDSERVVELAAGNRGHLHRAVDAYTPRGETPTGFALQEAGKDLGTEGRRAIVLVSDGEPTCPPAPCKVARDLRKQGIDIRIDVVGLSVDQKARESLQCVADAGGGVYYDADSAQELIDSLTAISERAARPYTAIGQPVVGAATAEDAPTVGAGDWVDTSAPAGRHVYYRIPRQWENSIVSASTAWRVGRGSAQYNLWLETPSGQHCDITNGSAGAGALAGNAVTLHGGSDEACFAAPELLLHVEYQSGPPSSPVEIRVVELGQVTNGDDLPRPGEPAWQKPPSLEPRTAVTGGTSFADAEPLEPGSYTGEIVVGEVLTFTVPADYGQQIHAQVTYPPLADGYQGVSGARTDLELYSPGRAPVTPSGGAAEPVAADGTELATMTRAPISLLHLGSQSDDKFVSLAGDYTIALSMGSSNTSRTPSIAVPFHLDVGVIGEVAGVPEFSEVPLGGEASGEPTEEPSGTTTTGSTDDSGDDSAAAGADHRSSDGISPVSYAVGGLGVVALIAAAALLGLRRRTAG